jgi:hypothetical protein
LPSRLPPLPRHALRTTLALLTDALERRDAFADVIALDLVSFELVVDSRLEDVDRRPPRRGWVIRTPDGLWEWQVRRDFVRTLPPGVGKSRLGTTLGGPRTRRRFEVALAAAGGPLHGAFRRFRRRRLRAYAGRVLRAALGLRAERGDALVSVEAPGCVP